MLSKRLINIANFVENGDNVADIGADHGKLIIYLANKYDNFFMAVENKIGPFEILQNNVKNSKNHNIYCSLSDGISCLKEEIDTLIFAGMGGYNVINIIKKDIHNLKDIKKIIICVNSNSEECLEFLHSIGFFLKQSKSLIDAKKLYFIFSLEFKESFKYSYSTSYLEVKNALKDKECCDLYINSKKRKYEIETQIAKSDKYYQISQDTCNFINYYLKGDVKDEN